MQKIEINGTPIAKNRPRFARRGKFVTTYSDQETEEGRTFLEIKNQWQGPPLSGAVRLSFLFEFKRPKGHFGTGKNTGVLKASAPGTYAKKPDLDNLEKFAMDCMAGTVFDDDAQVTQLASAKTWSNGSGKTTITIEEIAA